MKKWIFLFSIFYFLFYQTAHAAVFMVGTENPHAVAGEEVSINIGVDTEGARLNLFNLTLPLPADVEFVDFDNSKSIVSVWVREPVFDTKERTVSLIGGVPGGALGRVVLTTIKVRPQAPGNYQFTVASEAEAYLNDGLGTKVETSVTPWTLKVQGRSRNLVVYIIALAVFILLAIWYLWNRRKKRISSP